MSDHASVAFLHYVLSIRCKAEILGLTTREGADGAGGMVRWYDPTTLATFDERDIHQLELKTENWKMKLQNTVRRYLRNSSAIRGETK